MTSLFILGYHFPFYVKYREFASLASRLSRDRSGEIAKSCYYIEFHRSRGPVTNPLSMPRICERSDSGEKQSLYTSVRKVHQGGKYARAETFKLICFHLHPRAVCFGRASLAKSCYYTEFYRSRVPITNPLTMPRICERRDSGAWQSPYTSERKVHQVRKYARAETFKSICFHSRGVCFGRASLAK